jgi:hypothetical protein
MGWKRRANAVLARTTGLHLVRAVPPPAPAAGGRGPRPANRKAVDARPPQDPKVDRLLSRPVFVMCPLRSGSTLLRSLLNAHPLLHAPHELHVRRLSVRFGNRLVELAMRELGHNRADLEHLLWDRVLHRELQRSGKSYIVEKTPSNTFAYRRIATAWPDARFIFLIRHPVSIAESWTEANVGRRTREEAVEHALDFMRATQRAREALEGLTVRYEDLTDDPEGQTRRICDFLGVPWEAQMLDYGTEGVFTKGLGDWTEKIRSGSVQPGRRLPDPADVPDVLRDMCRAWGYLADA